MLNPKHIPLITFILFVAAIACAGGAKYPNPERKEQDKLWRPCQVFELQEAGLPVGQTARVCSRRCVKRESTKTCSKWKTSMKDMADPVDYAFFRDGSFILIDEDNL